MSKIQIKYHDKDITPIKQDRRGDGTDLYVSKVVSVNNKKIDHDLKNSPYEYKKGDVLLIDLGISVRLPEGFHARLFPRSSTYKYWGFTQVNSIGLIDNSYSGDKDIWLVQMKADRDGKLQHNEKICQFTIHKTVPVIVEEVLQLDEENRGGYGTSGKE